MRPPPETERGERERLLRERWAALPEALKHPAQLAGRSAVACGATHHVMERCDFACSCCYLGPEANKTEALPFEDVKAQLDELRAHLGPGGKAQITAGEVTLLPVDDLGRIVAYARAIGLDPMVMTHGQHFMDDPAYLERLVAVHGLRKISVHIDSTQRGRRGVPKNAGEIELNRVREAFAALIRRTRERTGHHLVAASTITVTEDNVGELAEVSCWFLANADAFRLLSFLPVAHVGRTRDGGKSDGLDDRLWAGVEAAVGRPINRHPMHFGHSKCNSTVPLIVGGDRGRTTVFEGLREGNANDVAMFSEAAEKIGPAWQWDGRLAANLASLTQCFLRRPGLLARSLIYGARRGCAEAPRLARMAAGALARGRRPRLSPFLVVVHRFMNPAELDTEEGRERVDACVFKVPVNGEMISMCEMNARGVREKIDGSLKKSRQTANAAGPKT